MAADFARLVSLACHDLRTPLATVQGFAKTLLRVEELAPEQQQRYLGLIDAASDELVELLDLLSLAARIEGGRYEPVVREADSLALAPKGASGAGATVLVDPERVQRALAALARAASRHGGVDVAVSVDGPEIAIEPVVAGAAAIVLGDEQKDLGAAV
ncbi:MAG TPA: histidine kinase dimerization/phospho-acceptor domain-containing protein, partial [Gaiellaceae bacterium]|nr:histidine kinase dimerization/phospho-acceptor domain-containing protein [Gaiellaceae bacterium]